MSFTTTVGTGLKIDQKMIVQALENAPDIDMEMMNNVFTNKPRVDTVHVTRELITDTVKAIPFNIGGAPIALNGETNTFTAFTNPPMKASQSL